MSTTTKGTFVITPLGDFSLRESAEFIGAWHEASSDRSPEAGHLHLAFLTDRELSPVGVCLSQNQQGAVEGEVYGSADASAVASQVSRILSLDVDGRGWHLVASRDRVVADLQRRFAGFRPVNWSSAYEAAAWAVMSTRIGMRQAQAVKDRMCRELGTEVDVHGHRMWTFPPPERLAHLESVRGLFGRKVEYLNGIGRAALAGELDTETLRALIADESLRRLRLLSGIGEFGSELVRLRALGAVDELPTRERRLLEAVRLAYGLPATPEPQAFELLAEKWRPYRMWVCVCLRRTLTGAAGGAASHRMTHSRAAG